MKWSDLIKMCLDSLKRRKGRTVLTVLGVFIGCVSIIVMISIGAGMRESTEQMIENMGDVTVIQVYADGGGEVKLDDEAVENFRSIAGVRAVMPKYTLNDYEVKLLAGASERYVCNWCTVMGLDTSAMEAMGYECVSGTFPERGEVAVGQYFAYEFFDSFMPEGSNYVDRWQWDEETQSYLEETPDPFFDPQITPVTAQFTPFEEPESTPFSREIKVSGILKEDYGKGWETSSGLMMDIEDMRALLNDLKGTTGTKFEYSEIYVKAESINEVVAVEDAIQELGYSTYSMQSIREELTEQTRRIELMLGGLGAISLLVAAIGITNTMTMSVSERTKEIGIMKAIGCYVGDIRKLFLMEAGSIGLIGGVLGLLFSFIVSVVINLFGMGFLGEGGGGVTWEAIRSAVFGAEDLARISVITPSLAVFALLFALMVGLLSGYQPANRAVKVPALEAIRSE